ncbi:matrixin family metalloprotease [Prosthecobacter sp.]|uniref:matrixin family metalloprotease n=1 Tax=Prosthecobacter sp. TaxID=1965333 RepID=UPI001D9A6EFA|nr:matrixin family metalloprotease [Prosthecobacter sp.]MCB1278005.1 matrixin family metalloprotease [Prosthecobacter sp.]
MKHKLATHFFVAIAASLISSCSLTQEKWREIPISYYKPQLWNKRHLTWRLDTSSPIPRHLSESNLRREIDKSFKYWESASVFTFSAATGEDADIVVSFEAPPGHRWDGQLGSMGHASFPWSDHPGRIYLDPSEWWSTKSFALVGDAITEWLPHEIGHVLGLQHTHEHDHTMSEMGPYKRPDHDSFAQLRRLYSPRTPVFTWLSCVTETAGPRVDAE